MEEVEFEKNPEEDVKSCHILSTLDQEWQMGHSYSISSANGRDPQSPIAD